MQHLVFTICKVSGLDVKGDRDLGFKLVWVPHGTRYWFLFWVGVLVVSLGFWFMIRIYSFHMHLHPYVNWLSLLIASLMCWMSADSISSAYLIVFYHKHIPLPGDNLWKPCWRAEYVVANCCIAAGAQIQLIAPNFFWGQSQSCHWTDHFHWGQNHTCHCVDELLGWWDRFQEFDIRDGSRSSLRFSVGQIICKVAKETGEGPGFKGVLFLCQAWHLKGCGDLSWYKCLVRY